jgi:phosphoribosylformylglycinamidine synthase
MAETGGVGVTLDDADTLTLFSEEQSRYLIACNFDMAEALMMNAGRAGVPLRSVGKFTGDVVRMGASEAPLEELASVFRTSFAEAVA